MFILGQNYLPLPWYNLTLPPPIRRIPNLRQMFVFHAEYRYAHLRYRVAKDQLSDYIHCLVISRAKDQKPKTASESGPIIQSGKTARGDNRIQ